MADEKCDGVAAPEFCSGLTVVSKHPIKNVEFLPFTDHGDFFWDYEYFLRRGAGVVTLEPRPGHTVAVVVTSLASIDYNYWYREHQAADLMQFLRHSTVLAGQLGCLHIPICICVLKCIRTILSYLAGVPNHAS